MTGPIVFVSHATIREGKLEPLLQMSDETFKQLEAELPGTVFQYGYLDEARSEVHFVHVFPDADAMDAHFADAGERSRRAGEFIESRAFEIYGTPSQDVLSAIERSGVDVVVKPAVLGGYLRLGD